MPTKNNNNKTAVGFGLAAVAAAAAGAYFLYGKDGAKNRKAIKGWMLKMKGEVLSQMEQLKEVNEDAYDKIVDAVAKKYQAVKQIDKTELAAMAADLKRHWNSINKAMKTSSAPKKPAARRKAKK